MLIERIGAVSGYNSHKEIDFGAKLALPALLADFRIINNPHVLYVKEKVGYEVLVHQHMAIPVKYIVANAMDIFHILIATTDVPFAKEEDIPTTKFF